MPPIKDLPLYYYHDHFMEMLGFVTEAYQGMLDDEHLAFINIFQGLSKDEQCLYIRMANRKGTVFCQKTLVYGEISNVKAAIKGLLNKGLARTANPTDYSDLLRSLPKADLLLIANQHGIEGIKPSWTKSRLVVLIQEQISFDLFQGLSTTKHLVQLQKDQLDFLLYLYFGKTHEDLKSFALRDLGIVRVKETEQYTARFDDADEAIASFTLNRLLNAFNSPEPKACLQAISLAETYQNHPSHYVLQLKDRLCHKTGQIFERLKDIETAITAYRLGESFECQERFIRLTHQHVCKDQAKGLLEQVINDPVSDEAYIFATDFYARKYGQQKLGLCTELLRNSTQITVEEVHRKAPEMAAGRYFRKKGWQAYHTENSLWRTLFGLLFWDELFGSLHSSFDRMPQSLKNRSFHIQYEDVITKKLDKVRQGKALPIILKSVSTHWNQPNGVFGWYEVDTELLTDFLSTDNREGIAIILEHMASNYYEMRDGFPDLTLIRGGQAKFIEIKAVGDQLRRNQLARLRLLQRVGFEADICKVQYGIDENQPYVVIDIETTGGRPGPDRITEIGAVKIINNEVVAEWQSLVNPQRRIPYYISELTGISDAMVQDAPLFSEIAASLSEFLSDSIFVAHNVNFDYGFIAYEYERIGEGFRYPKLCTKVEMRRHFPGQKSYSLANLCDRYDINLTSHHRALCDAKAAAELLLLINKERIAKQLLKT